MGTDDRFEVKNEKVRDSLRNVAKIVAPLIPKGFGFTLLIFSFGEGGSMFYISDAERASMITAMKEFIAKQEKK